MKRFASLLAVLILTLFFASCTAAPTPKNLLAPVESLAPTGDAEKIAEYLKEALPEQSDLIPQVYGESALLNVGHEGNGGVVLFEMDYSRTNANAHIHALDDILNRYPTKNIRSVAIDGAEQTYLVYMTDRGTRLYLFFKDNYLTGYPILMKKTLSHSDFSGLSVDDPIESVERIDPVAGLYREQYDIRPDSALKDEWLDITLTTNHLLTDGFLQIQYDRDQARRYTVRSLEFRDDFTATNIPTSFPEDVITEQVEKSFTHLYRILPKDYTDGELQTNDPVSPQSMPEGEETLLSEVDWTVEVEGAEQTAFSLADAQKLSLTKIFAAYYPGGDAKNSLQSRIFQGVRFSDFLEAVGAPDARSVTIVDTDGKEREIPRDLFRQEKCVLAWILNKTLPIENSASHVAFAAQEGAPEDYIPSVAKIVIVG